jgi:hypothetical protein
MDYQIKGAFYILIYAEKAKSQHFVRKMKRKAQVFAFLSVAKDSLAPDSYAIKIALLNSLMTANFVESRSPMEEVLRF